MSEYAKIYEEDPAYRPAGLGGVAACVRSLICATKFQEATSTRQNSVRPALCVQLVHLGVNAALYVLIFSRFLFAFDIFRFFDFVSLTFLTGYSGQS